MKNATTVPVIVETARGQRNKMSFDFTLGMLRLTKVLPAGFAFPHHFGAIPGTRADDGDPLDVLLLMADHVPPGSLLEARPIGVLEATQKEKGKSQRNDRLVAVAVESHEHRRVRSVSGLDPEMRGQIQDFFVSYNAGSGKEFRPLGWYGPERAAKLIAKAKKRYRPEKAKGRSASFTVYRKAASGQ